MKHATRLTGLALAVFCGLIPVQLVFSQMQIPNENVKVKLEFGHRSGERVVQTVVITGASAGVAVSLPSAGKTEENDVVAQESVLNCGAGDTDEIIVGVEWIKPAAELRQPGPSHTNIWRWFFENGSPGQVNRLLHDPWRNPDAPVFTVKLNREGTKGFSVGLEQLVQQGAMWLPEQDVFITLAENPVNFDEYLSALKGERTLKRIQNEPDASLEQFRKVWTDFGNPLVSDPSWQNWQTQYMGTTGHLTVTAAAHGSIYKFAVDRHGNIRPDFASPYKFMLDIEWPGSQWKSQEIENGLPVLVTRLQENRQSCEIEQFACPLGNAGAAVRGYIPGMMLTKVKFSGEPGEVNFKVTYGNETSNSLPELKKTDDNRWILTENQTGKVMLMLETASGWSVNLISSTESGNKVELNVTGQLKNNPQELVIKLPSPEIEASQLPTLEEKEFAIAKKGVINYWEEWLSGGAQFNVPEETVNQLFRASLWHALVLPRHTIGTDNEPHMDIPYSNIAYGQQNADWPINQAVYVDYMIYGLRGYEEVAENEIAAMFKSQQLPDGKLGGYANWGVYSPGHLYAIAQNYLLSS